MIEVMQQQHQQKSFSMQENKPLSKQTFKR